MQLKTNSASPLKASRSAKPIISATSAMLTPSEIESLRQQVNENGAYFQRAFEKMAHENPDAA